MENTNPSYNKVREEKIKKGRKKEKGQDISKEVTISFKYEDFEQAGMKYMPGVRKNTTRYYYDTVDILDQSQFRFILNLSDLHGNYTKYSYQNNTNIKWEDINTIIYKNSTEIYTCPICLEKKLICPKITRCGHIFCWPCLLNYYDYWTKSAINKKVPQCPLCKDKIDIHQIKFCEIQQSVNYSEPGDATNQQSEHYVSFNLIMKDRKAPTLYNINHDPDLEFYKRNVTNTNKDIFTFLPLESQEQFSFSRIFLTSPQLLQKRYAKFKFELQNALKDELSGYADERKVESITRCLDNIEARLLKIKESSTDVNSGDEQERDSKNELSREDDCQVRSFENRSTVDEEPKLLDDEAKLDYKSFTYFYQENLGDSYYLHPIDYNILMAEYEGEEYLPTEISVSIS
jgi:hypothetical protein